MATKEVFLEDLTESESGFSLGKHQCSVCHEQFPPANWPLEKTFQYDPGKQFLLHAEAKHKPEDGFEFRVPAADEPVRCLISAGVMGTRFVSKDFRDNTKQSVRVYSDSPSSISPSNISWKLLSYRPRKK